jgi:hypothetical protein
MEITTSRLAQSDAESLISFSEHALLIVEERLREQEPRASGCPRGCRWMSMPFGVMIAAQTGQVPRLH